MHMQRVLLSHVRRIAMAGVIGLVGQHHPGRVGPRLWPSAVLIAADAGAPTPNADRYMEEIIPPETNHSSSTLRG